MGLQPSPAQNAPQVEQLPPGSSQNPDLAVGHPWTPLHPCSVMPDPYTNRQYINRHNAEELVLIGIAAWWLC